MRADGGDPQVRLVGERRELAPQFNDVFARVRDRGADLSAKLDDRLVHLRLDLFLQENFSSFEDFLNVRTQLPGLWIDDREFLFDPERERVVRGGHVLTTVSRAHRATSSCS